MFLYLLLILLHISLCRSEELLIKDAGVGYIDEDDIAMIFYVTLENKAEKEFEVSVCMAHCCDTANPNEMDCNSMSLIGGDMGILPAKCVKNVTLIYPNLYLMNRQGQCSINIRYRNEGGVRQRMARIDFNTIIANEDGCECSSLDMDPKQNCRPVDCVIKYSGMKSYFDARRMECIYVTKCLSPPDQCVPEIGYSIAVNNCTNLNNTIGKDDLHLLDSNRSETNECITCPLSPEDGIVNLPKRWRLVENVSFDIHQTCYQKNLEYNNNLKGNTVCHHGSFDNNGQCECDAGWTTTTDEEIYSPTLLLYHMCNVEVGAWNCLNKGRIRTTTILIAIFAVTIASKILILMCILNWCYKRYKYRKTKICSDKLDPDREEIILCEELQQFDECTCEEPPKKPHFLETQTVNVSYYPCLPSVLSSIHGSSGSEKCNKCSLVSEESIVLSKTTTSSAHVYFESESEAATEISERAAEVGNEEAEFSGEGTQGEAEEGSDLEEAVREEEIYGERGKSEDDVYEEFCEEYDEQSEYTGYSENASRRSTSSKTKSMSTTKKSRSSVKFQK